MPARIWGLCILLDDATVDVTQSIMVSEFSILCLDQT